VCERALHVLDYVTDNHLLPSL